MQKMVLLLSLIPLVWLFVLVFSRWAQRRVLDIPNDRSSHRRTTPRGGGLVIVIVALAAGLWSALTGQFTLPLVAYLAGGSLIAIVSWIDDLRSLPNRTRFVCHATAAAFVTAALAKSVSHHAASLPWWILALPLMLWIVGFTNLYNFMDGIDGLAGGQAVVAALWWIAAVAQGDLPLISVLAIAIGAASAGFLLHNWSPARIFMGDVGSTFLGYTFAVLPLLALALGGAWLHTIGGVLAIWPFLFDGSLTIFRRLLNGENIFRPHRSHLYQRLVISGYSHARVSTLYLIYAAICSLCGFALVRLDTWIVILLPPMLGLALLLWVSRIERRTSRQLSTA